MNRIIAVVVVVLLASFVACSKRGLAPSPFPDPDQPYDPPVALVVESVTSKVSVTFYEPTPARGSSIKTEACKGERRCFQLKIGVGFTDVKGAVTTNVYLDGEAESTLIASRSISAGSDLVLGPWTLPEPYKDLKVKVSHGYMYTLESGVASLALNYQK